jgi:CheY-like chemotaxis protein
VLLVEDVKVHRELIEMYFEGSGVKFDFAENGVVACDMFLSNPDGYSLILMDIKMPVMNGYDAARKIRGLDVDWAKQIPIIAITADATEDDIGKCFEAGMDDHIVKPIDMDALQEKVFEFITRDTE